MAEIAEVFPSKIICGILYYHKVNLEEVLSELESHWGKVDVLSKVYCFSDGSSYYEKEMGSPIQRVFCSFEKLVDPSGLAELKLTTQIMEQGWSSKFKEVTRPVNLDPGHITRGRMLLATTKDFAHRIYLHSGIYAEVTLLFKKNKVEPLAWTYPDLASGYWDEDLLKMRHIYQKGIS